MSGVALVSAKGAPGVTTSTVLLAAVWPSPAVVLEADPAGGDLRSWYADTTAQPLRADVGVVSLLARHAAGASLALTDHCQRLPGGLPVLIGPETRAQFGLLRSQLPQLAAAIQMHERDVLVDLGRLDSSDLQEPLLESCSVTLFVCRASVTSIRHTRSLLGSLPHPGRVLLIGGQGERCEVAQALGLPTEYVLVLPNDAEAAAGLAGTWTRRLDRSPLVSAARHVAAAVHEHVLAAEPSGFPRQPVAEGVSTS
jgi:hypothetical protein